MNERESFIIFHTRWIRIRSDWIRLDRMAWHGCVHNMVFAYFATMKLMICFEHTENIYTISPFELDEHRTRQYHCDLLCISAFLGLFTFSFFDQLQWLTARKTYVSCFWLCLKLCHWCYRNFFLFCFCSVHCLRLSGSKILTTSIWRPSEIHRLCMKNDALFFYQASVEKSALLRLVFVTMFKNCNSFILFFLPTSAFFIIVNLSLVQFFLSLSYSLTLYAYSDKWYLL